MNLMLRRLINLTKPNKILMETTKATEKKLSLDHEINLGIQEFYFAISNKMFGAC